MNISHHIASLVLVPSDSSSYLFNIGDLKPTRHAGLEDTFGIVLERNLLQVGHVLLSVSLKRVLRQLCVVKVLPVYVHADVHGVLLERLAKHLETLTSLGLLTLALDHHLDLEEDGVVSDAVKAKHVATLGNAVLRKDGGDGLEDGMDEEVAVGRLLLPIGDELLADFEGLVVQFNLVLEGDGENNVAVLVRSPGSYGLDQSKLTGSRWQFPTRL